MGLIGNPEEEIEKYIELKVTDIRGEVYQDLRCLLHSDCIGKFSKTPDGDYLLFTEQSGTIRCRFR